MAKAKTTARAVKSITTEAQVPLDISPVEWHQYTWLHNAYHQCVRWQVGERHAHALLITGQQGIGKHLLIKKLVQYLLCLTPENGEPCGQCASCHWLRQGYHPDLLCVRCEKDSKIIKVEQIRELIQFMQLTPQQRYRIIFIQDAERMNLAAANSVLKTLEEPQGESMIFLTSSTPERLPITVRSRTQRYHLATPTLTQSLSFLQQAFPDAKYQEEDWHRFLMYSQGAPLRLQERLQGIWLKEIDQLKEYLRQALHGKPVVVDESALSIIDAIEILCVWLNQALHYQLGLNDESVIEEIKILSKFSTNVLMNQYQALLGLLKQSSTQVRLDWQLQVWFRMWG